MTRRLILMRHAKSSWDFPELSDHDRPLNKRGRGAAAALGKWLQAMGYVPDEILPSTAQRAIETAELAKLPKRTFRTVGTYNAGPAQLLRELRGATGDTVMMVAHNPGIANFAEEMVVQAPDHDRFWDYPSGATTVIEFDISDWRRVAPRTGRVLDFVIPRELPEA